MARIYKNTGIKHIHKYWRNLALNDDGALLKKIGDYAFETILETDGDACYACGKACRVQRAHIIPDSLGGSEEPDNLFLLCIPCHQANPDTTYTDMFYSFIRNVKPHFGDWTMQVKGILDTLYKEASADERASYESVFSRVEYSPKDLWDNDGMDQIGTGLNNAMSAQTMAIHMWKTLTQATPTPPQS